uniref:Cell division cycle and apoptosis regulator protein 1-like isoform X1 n=1 Tax=Diabrotica virgifera virgifera TaxID=50390 RepID=A0A6P7GZB4_DIAVI
MNNNMGYNNKAWGRTNNSSNLMNQNQLQSQQPGGLGNMVPFPGNQQIFQNPLGLQQQNLGLGLQQINNAMTAAAALSSQVASNPIFQQVSYPNSRGLNPKAFQSNLPLQNSQNNGSGRQRVFTGKVTQMHDNFGLVDEEVVFQMNVCVMGSRPTVGDRVLVEAQNTPNMPFKWNATRIQVITGSQSRSYGSSNYVPQSDRRRRDGKGRDRSRDRDRDDDEVDRKRRREDRVRDRERDDRKSPIRKRSKSRSRSPKGVRRRPRIIPRYMVQIPKINLDLDGGDVLELKRRYKNMYIPSDFFFTSIKWVDSFPADKPFAINKPCSFQIMHKDVAPVLENRSSDPPDADYLFSAKVMLMSTPGLDEIYHRCCSLADDKDNDEKDYVHPTRLIDFLIGLRGKNETMAIGGAWSPSLDGENPKEDPTVLIKTAIRTCKNLTGIDLSNCTQWYRFLELYYRRSESTYKGKTIPARVETVVLFLPDVWSCLPTRVEWDDLQNSYKKQCERILTQPETVDAAADGAGAAESGGSGDAASRVADTSGDQSSQADEKEDEPTSDKLEPTHHSQLDPKGMVVNDLRNELTARGLSTKGLKSQLAARLMKALASEAEKGEAKEKETKEVESESETSVVEVRKEVEEKKMDDKEKAMLERRHTLPEHPQIIVHPSKSAKSGKFECTTMSLSLLLDYRTEDSKEHSFEVSLFAELFNEMLSRDFGFNIYKTLYALPEKKEEKKDKKEGDGKEDKKDDKAEVKEGGDNEEKATNAEEGGDATEKKEDDKKDKASNGDKKKEESDDDSEKRKERERKKKEKIKLYTKDKHLLLSFVYFDQTQCGYIFDKDIEDLLYTLGLKQSRAQIKKMISKVIVRDSLHYRKLTDKPKNAEDESAEEPPKELDLAEIAQGNRKLLPVFGAKESSEKGSKRRTTSTLETTNGFVKFRGSVVDVGKLLNQLERSEQIRVDTEARMIDLKNENQKLSEKYHKSNSTIKQLTSDLRENKDKLRNANDVLSKTNTHSKLYYQTLLDIKDKIDPIVRTSHKEEKKERDEKDRDRKQDDGKSRWEKDKDHAHSKKEEKEEVKKEKEKEKEKENEKEKDDDDVEMSEVKKEKD